MNNRNKMSDDMRSVPDLKISTEMLKEKKKVKVSK